MNSTENIRVTLGIPTYSRLEYLKQSTASALIQNYPNLEILISQNPHPNLAIRDAITQYCTELVTKDSRVRYQILPEDKGPPANFNSIAESASGEYLMMIGDDDRLLPDAIGSLASAVGPETVLAFGKRYAIDAEGKRLEQVNGSPVWFESAQNQVPHGRLANPSHGRGGRQ